MMTSPCYAVCGLQSAVYSLQSANVIHRPVVVRGKCPEEMPETNSNAMGVVNSKLAQCPLLEKQDKNPRTVVNFRAYIVSKSVGQDIFVYSRLSPFPRLLHTLPAPPDFLLCPHLYRIQHENEGLL